jgi:tetratricopeptide (TPR) repeat protein
MGRMQHRSRPPIRKPVREKSGNILQAAHARLVEAEACRRAGRLDRARKLCEALLGEYPDYVGALQTLGVAHLATNSYRQALSCFIQAAMLCPKDWVNLGNLGNAYLKLGAHEAAAQVLEQARRLKPDDPGIHWSLAELHREDRDYAGAADAYRTVLNLSPLHADAAHGLGDTLLQLADAAQAAPALKRAHELNPRSVAILYSLSQLPSAAADIDILKGLDAVLPQEGQDRADFEILIGLTRAAALDRQGRHAEAWASLLEANRREFPRHQQADRRNALRMDAAYHAALSEGGPVAERVTQDASHPMSLFIIGPSRAGKSTLERLVGALDGVKRGFESRLVEPAARRTSQLAGLLTAVDPVELPRSLDAQFRKIYLEDLGEFAHSARIVTDTHPGMITAVGRIAAIIPNVRFVFIRRDSQDLALRILMRRYRTGNHYAYDIGTIFEHLSRYDQLMDLWMERFPRLAIALTYEDLTTDPKATLARVAGLCGATVPDRPLPVLGDDRNCSQPYRELMAKALAATHSGRRS